MLRKLVYLTIAIIVIVLVGFGCADRSNPIAPESTMTTVTGNIFGVITVPRDSLTPETRPENFIALGQWIEKGPGRAIVNLIEDGSIYEFRTTYPVDSLALEVGGVPAELRPDGSFIALNVPVDRRDLVFKFRGEAIRSDTCSMEIRNSGAPLVIDILYEKKPCKSHKHDSGELFSFPCLDNNGMGPYGFVYSDCYMSLWLNWCYGWMCWLEAMDRYHDHYGNIWCNGTHNCSLFVHSWNWNSQYWHRHYSFWWPSTGC